MQKTQTLPEVLSRELSRSINALKTAAGYGVTYHVVMPDGTTHSNLPTPAVKPKKRMVNPKGSLTVLYMDKVKDMKPGDVVVIECDKKLTVALRSSLSAYCSGVWGANAHTSHVDVKKGIVEVMRTA